MIKIAFFSQMIAPSNEMDYIHWLLIVIGVVATRYGKAELKYSHKIYWVNSHSNLPHRFYMDGWDHFYTSEYRGESDENVACIE